MASLRNLTFRLPVANTGNNLDFISTTDVQIPQGSEVALQSCQFTQELGNAITGDFRFNYFGSGAGAANSFEVQGTFPSNPFLSSEASPQNFQNVLDFLNTAYRRKVRALATSQDGLFTQLLGSTSSFFNQKNKLAFKSEQFFLRGVGSVLAIGGQTELQVANIDATTEDDKIALANRSKDPGVVQSTVAMPSDKSTSVSLVRFCPDVASATVTENGRGILALYQTAAPGPTDTAVVEIQHNYYASGTLQTIKPGSPYLNIVVRGKIEIQLPTKNGTIYEIRKFGSFLSIHRNVRTGSIPPVDRNGVPVDWQSGLLFRFQLSATEAALFPQWRLIPGGSDTRKSRKTMSQCYYVAESSYDPTQELPHNFDSFEETPINQQFFTPNVVTSCFFEVSNADAAAALGMPLTQFIGSTTLDVGPAGYKFTFEAPNPFGAEIELLPHVAVSILEPFRVAGLDIKAVGFGNTLPNSVLARFSAEEFHLALNGTVVFSTDNPQFYPIEARGTINAKNFRFAIRTGDDALINLQGEVIITLLIRSNTSVLAVY